MAQHAWTQRIAATALAGMLTFGTGAPALAMEAQSTQQIGSRVERLYGTNRYETMAQVIKTTEGSGWYSPSQNARPRIVVASGEEYTGALIANGAAGSFLHARLVLTNGSSLSPAAAEIMRQHQNAIVCVIGSTDAMSNNVVNDINNTCGIPLENFSSVRGSTPTELSLNVLGFVLTGEYTHIDDVTADSLEYDALNHTNPSTRTIIVASGGSFADALSASGASYEWQAPFVLTDSSGNLNSSARSSLERLLSLEDDVMPRVGSKAYKINFLIVGGPASVSSETESFLQGLANRYSCVTYWGRIGGRDRYDTSSLFAQQCYEDIHWNSAVVVSGRNYPDALASGQLAASKDAPVLLVDDIQNPTVQLIGAKTTSSIKVVGGENSVPYSLAYALGTMG